MESPTVKRVEDLIYRIGRVRWGFKRVDDFRHRQSELPVVKRHAGTGTGASHDAALQLLQRDGRSWTLFGKTCATTQKNVKSHVFFWILKKKRKKTYI